MNGSTRLIFSIEQECVLQGLPVERAVQGKWQLVHNTKEKLFVCQRICVFGCLFVWSTTIGFFSPQKDSGVVLEMR